MRADMALASIARRADAAFQDKDYQTAFEIYELLGKEASDQYAQYKLSIMYQHGLHADKDMLTAYAWATVASETGIQPFVELKSVLFDSIQKIKKAQAKTLSQKYIRDYGMYQFAINAGKTLRKLKFSCTGSRVGNTCDRVSSSSADCSMTVERLPNKQCLQMGRIGLNSVGGSFPLRLRSAEKLLTRMMNQYSPGKVILHDIEIEESDVTE